ncbi:CLUMA_CG014531, isoform A [Clunio marinus]|uniref:CLUMA_CG014531, isoform A n=1 Tax=Clunio marinus TaxID=568069 RepID=A0A1J1IM88_9DIPT|nr:CLUMA_CG014531, isoform A [Clunio marinus]
MFFPCMKDSERMGAKRWGIIALVERLALSQAHLIISHERYCISKTQIYRQILSLRACIFDLLILDKMFIFLSFSYLYAFAIYQNEMSVKRLCKWPMTLTEIYDAHGEHAKGKNVEKLKSLIVIPIKRLMREL